MGRTYDFVDKLSQRGYSWDIYKRCLIGPFFKVPNCEVYCNSSCSEIPLYSVKVRLPESCPIESANALSEKIIQTEFERNPDRRNDPIFLENGLYRDKVSSRIEIHLLDTIGFGIMMESFVYTPSNNNLSTID